MKDEDNKNAVFEGHDQTKHHLSNGNTYRLRIKNNIWQSYNISFAAENMINTKGDFNCQKLGYEGKDIYFKEICILHAVSQYTVYSAHPCSQAWGSSGC